MMKYYPFLKSFKEKSVFAFFSLHFAFCILHLIAQLTHPETTDATLTPRITNNAITIVSTPAFMLISRIANAAAKSVITQNANAATSPYR
jgi:hypothetical protein